MSARPRVFLDAAERILKVHAPDARIHWTATGFWVARPADVQPGHPIRGVFLLVEKEGRSHFLDGGRAFVSVADLVAAIRPWTAARDG